MASRHWFGRWLAIIAGLWCAPAIPCFGQIQFGVRQPPQDGVPPVMMIIPPNRETLQALHHAQEALKQNRTADAFQLLQRLIELPEDYFTDKSMQQTLKSETLRILSGLSSKERQSYELLQGTSARNLLAEARTIGDSTRLAEVVRRYPLTQAGLEAAEMLAIEALDRGQVWLAAVQFSQLRQWPMISAGQSRQMGLREALAWHLAGQTSRAADLLVELTSTPATFRAEIAGQSLPNFTDADHAARWLAQITKTAVRSMDQESADWLSPRGSPAGSSPVRATGPIGGPLWQVAHLAALEAELSPSSSGTPGETLTRRLAAAEVPLKETEQLPWTTPTPLVVGELMVFRTARDIAALDCRTGEVRWRSVLADPDFDQLWSQEAKSHNNPDAGTALSDYLRERLFADRAFGSLSSDGRLVFALEGLEYDASAIANNINGNIQFFGGPQTEDDGGGQRSNRLTAYELNGGRLAWEIGGDRTEAAGDFAGHYFLGPPLSCDGKLFVLAEVQGEIRMLALESEKGGLRKIWSQPLIAPTLKITGNDERRKQGLMPACANGIVVCPTGAGAVIAIDFALRRLLWAYQYPSTDAPGAGNALPFARPNPLAIQESSDQSWLDGNPIIVDGRVFLTPTDSDELHCLSLADGKTLWKPIPRNRAVYLAGADSQRAVLVGPDQIEAVRVADGTPAWNDPIPIPAPAGRGVWMTDRLLMPLSTGEIATVDLAKGRMLGRSRIPGGHMPGHLAANAHYLVSLSAQKAMAFRSLEQTEAIVAKRLAADPEDAEGLALRGEARLHRGNVNEGLADLRASIAKQSQPYAKSILAAALLEGLRADFVRYRDTIAELEMLTDDPQQRNEFLWLVARGLKDAGQPLAAFERMTHLIDHSLDEFSVEAAGGPWQARNDRRLWGLFAALYRRANPEDRQKLDAQILSRLPDADAAPETAVASTDALRRYLRAFGFHPSAVAARQRLVSLLDPEKDAVEYQRELSRLANSPDLAVAAPATGKLARWSLSRQRFDDVEMWLAAFDGRFADVVCDADQTGRKLAEELRANAEYLEYRKLQHIPWPEGEISQSAQNQVNQSGRMRRVPIVGAAPAHYLGWSFEVDQQGTMLFARDELGRRKWALHRSHPVQPNFIDSQPAMHRVHLNGHLIAWSSGTTFLVAADVEPQQTPPRILWQESLLPPVANSNFVQNQMIPMQRPRRLPLPRFGMNPFAFALPPGVGALVAVTDSGVIYHNGRKLFAADPLTGKLLWSRKDLPRALLDVLADHDAVAMLEQDIQQPGEGPPTVSLLRTIDGEYLSLAEPPKGIVEWIGGSRALTADEPSRRGEGATKLELRDVVRGERIWYADLARPAVIRVWNQDEVFTLEENRRLTVRNLYDGTVRWTQDLTLAEVAVETMHVQRWQDRYLVVLGSATPPPAGPGSVSIMGFYPQEVPLYGGYVAALDRKTGQLVWQTGINEPATDPTGFDVSQPAGWPALLFVGKMIVRPAAPIPGFAAQQSQRLTVTLIDKRTGKQLYSREEPSNIGEYFVDLEPERNRMTVNFNWSVELHYGAKRRK